MWTDRIKELRRVKPSDLAPSPKNWRSHPEAQRAAVNAVLDEVGIASAILARELEDGSLMIIDGHLRQDLDPEQEWPVLVLDVNEAEADVLLATIDPLAAMAGQDDELLRSLLGSLDDDKMLLAQMAMPDLKLVEFLAGTQSPDDFQEFDEDIETDHECPKCGYRFSGGSAVNNGEA